ncbi:MAG: four-carbon acid sugar kinase family protein [Burkholderiales bacterium]|nr:four-carbon acid sugar kinase family protein [Burkholderiales bacterium]
MAPPAIVYYGDDFTGATDTLGTAARAGLRALLFLRLPSTAQLHAAGALDCLGIAGAARAMSPDEMRAELAPVAALFGRLGARVLHYKVCSTFDSAPAVGSIGVAVDTLRRGVPGAQLAVIGGQPDLGRYCLFGNLFARAGSEGEVYRIDRHPTMSRHPVTPMHEADLRCHLALQGLDALQAVPWTWLADATDARPANLFDAAAGEGGVLFDVADAASLSRIGELLWRTSADAPVLAAGASSVVQALAPRIASGPAPARPLAPVTGPVFALAGSLSPVTAAQVAQAQPLFETLWIDPQRLCESEAFVADTAGRLVQSLQAGRHTLACTVRPGQPPAGDAGVGGRDLALAGGRLLRRVLDAAPQVRRVVVAGGDTSSHGVQALDAWGLSYLAAVSPGVSLCRLHSDRPRLDGLEIALKGGQMGAPDLFGRLVAGDGH